MPPSMLVLLQPELGEDSSMLFTKNSSMLHAPCNEREPIVGRPYVLVRRQLLALYNGGGAGVIADAYTSRTRFVAVRRSSVT